MVSRGFIQTSEDVVICRFRYDDLMVDVMATKSIGWAPGNRWFEQGFGLAFSYDLDDLKIRLLPLPYFLATKFDAFFDRGINDIWASHDYEDIVYLFNHTSDITEQVLQSEEMVKKYIKEYATKIINNRSLQEGVLGSLFYEAQEQSFEFIMSKLSRIANSI